MKLLFIAITLSFLITKTHAREILSLNQQWEFRTEKNFSDIPPTTQEWQTVNLPHDWSWQAGPRKNGAQAAQGGYRIAGIGWYRKKFELPANFANKTIFGCFDGIYHRSTVFLNGQEVGRRPYGFISFRYDLTPYLKKGSNTLIVRADCRLEPSTRWYHPCGIYAPVCLEAAHPTSRIVHDGIIIRTPQIKDTQASIHLSAEIQGSAKAKLHIQIFDPTGKEVTKSEIKALELTKTLLTVPDPQLWSPQTPALYQASLTLKNDHEVLDLQKVSFGIRQINWDKDTGFSLNGRQTKLKGVCEHLTGGPLGGAWPKPLLEWKLRLLKDMGCNAIRTAHNPQIPAFYDLCDQLGILVMDEIFDGWRRKAEHDYGAHNFKDWWQRDLTDWIRRDRNHPCVIIWSVGNETGGPIAKELVSLCHQLDETRLVTSGHSASQHMDVYGVNGHSESQKFFSEKRPEKAFVATEAPHTWQVRGFYKSKTWYRDGYPNQRQSPFETPDLTETEIFRNAAFPSNIIKNRKQIFQSSYDNAYVRINARQAWEKARDLPWYSGHFRWTGFDYPGEASYVHGGLPFHSFSSGALDLAGFPKDLYHFYRSQWTFAPMVHLLPHWTHPLLKKGTLIPVQAYSNAEEIELFLNDKSLGIQKPGKKWNRMACQWLVPWTPGTLRAIARNDGKQVAEQTIESSTSPRNLKIETDNRTPDFPIIDISIVDEKNRPYPYGENNLNIRIDGQAKLLSFENGDPSNLQPPSQKTKRAFMGKARLFLHGTDAQITIGGIFGERSQITSPLYSIKITSVSTSGTIKNQKFDIRYTLDKTEPTLNSPLYQKPFSAKGSHTIRATAFSDGKPFLMMREDVGKNKGLHWLSPSENLETNTSQAIQAETAKTKNGTIKNNGNSFRGTGYIDFEGKEGSITFYQENDGSAGDATLTIRYTHNDPNTKRPLKVILNNKLETIASFKKTGSWNTNWQTIKIPVHLKKGANTLTLESNGSRLPNIDEILFE